MVGPTEYLGLTSVSSTSKPPSHNEHSFPAVSLYPELRVLDYLWLFIILITRNLKLTVSRQKGAYRELIVFDCASIPAPGLNEMKVTPSTCMEHERFSIINVKMTAKRFPPQEGNDR